MSPQRVFEITSTLFFILALGHTFLAGYFSRLSHKYKNGTFFENFFCLMGEVEIVFGLWTGIFIVVSIFLVNFEFVNSYLETRNFTEALFVFVVMAICSSKPIVSFFENLIIKLGGILPIDKNISTYVIILIFGPLLGSIITEPASITISAFLLLPRFFMNQNNEKFKYATLAVLLLNTSIGGTLTNFAAPPVLMVAKKWNWNASYMLNNFAIPTILSIIVNTLLLVLFFKKNITTVKLVAESQKKEVQKIPLVITLIHAFFLGLVILASHYPIFFIGIFLFYLGFIKATKEYQGGLIIREPLLVGFFIAGLVVLGGPQKWWIEPFVISLDNFKLYLGSIFLTAFTDNAALTYLGTLVTGLDETSKLILVKGSVVGGGLTVIANAPNPAALGILGTSFKEKAFSSVIFLMYSVPLTILTAIIFFVF